MRSISFEAFVAGAGLTMDRLNIMRQRDQLAGAFARNAAYKSIGYIELDAVGQALVDVFGTLVGKTRAARWVRIHFDTWAKAVAIAEHRPRQGAFFTIVEQQDRYGRPGHFACGTNTDDPAVIKQMADRLTGLWTFRTHAIDMRGIIADVRARARKAGFDLSDAFIHAPDDPELAKLLAPFTAVRDEAARIVEEGGKADKAAEDRLRRAGIIARAFFEAVLPEGGKPS
jgi:hypothetical protein